MLQDSEFLYICVCVVGKSSPIKRTFFGQINPCLIIHYEIVRVDFPKKLKQAYSLKNHPIFLKKRIIS